MSAPIWVGKNPVLDFDVWCGYGAYGTLEVNPGSGWYTDMTPKGDYGHYLFNTSNNWIHIRVYLDDNRFGSRAIQVRFNANGLDLNEPGLYVDNLSVSSERDPGVWVVSCTPSNGAPSSTVPVTLTAYNSTTNTLLNVMGVVGSPELGVSFSSGVPVLYGTMGPGDVSSGTGAVGLVLGSIGNFANPSVQLTHLSKSGIKLLGEHALPFRVNGVTVAASTNTLTVKSVQLGVGVTNWVGTYLQGDGGPTSCLFQVIYAGTNGIAQPPLPNGQVTGDDRVLYSAVLALPWGFFGEGGVPSDAGQFKKTFNHNLPAGARVYVRAFDASSFGASVAYGDSPFYTLGGQLSQTRDFGAWLVGTPLDANRDSDGDTITDGYAILHGMNPRNFIGPLAPTWVLKNQLGNTSGNGQFASSSPSPTRVIHKGNFLYALDTGHNKIQVWNRFTSTYVGSYGVNGPGTGQFSRPCGLGLDPRPGTNRFAVADQGNFRIQVFQFNPTTGTNVTFLFSFGDSNIFTSVSDVAIAPDGRFYVTDLSSVRVFSPAGVFQSNLATLTPSYVLRPRGVTVGPDGRVVVADTENNCIQSWNAANVWQWSAGGAGTNAGQLMGPRDAAFGPGNMIYVADTVNSRLVVFRTNGTHVATLGSHGYSFDIQMVQPYSLSPVVDSNIVYVADTFNSRILTVSAFFDSDGDGIDDVWEILHGLNPMDPTDALLDFNGNGISNIGEYRLGQDPGLPLRITAFSVNPAWLSWEQVVTGGIYRIEYSFDHVNLASNSWQSGPSVTSGVAGVMTWANTLSLTNAIEYFRVIRIGP